jgi:nucleoside transporter
MTGSVRNKLSVMMFLQFFIWGAWYELAFGYVKDLDFKGWQQSTALATFNLAAFVAMFFSTQFADRHFAAQKFLAFSHLVGGVAILVAAFFTDFWFFSIYLLLHSLFYVPTISISNSIAFAHLKDAQKDFGLVRVWGTIGWIVASWPFIFILVDWASVPSMGEVGFVDWIGKALGTPATGLARTRGVSWSFVVAAIASFVLAGYSLLLPHTPPKPATQAGERFAWLSAVKLLRLPFLMVLFIVTFLDSSVHQCYFVWTERFLREGLGMPSNWVMPAMKVSQLAEIGTMGFLGFFLVRMGWRMTMILGILGHAVRFAVFAWLGGVSQPGAVEMWAAVAINLVHGICYAFFFATVYIFVDEYFPKDARSSAQGLFNFLILGAGPLVGNFVWPWLGDTFFTAEMDGSKVVQFNRLFAIPSATGALAALILLLFFHPPRKVEPKPEEVPVAPEGAEAFEARPRPDLA